MARSSRGWFVYRADPAQLMAGWAHSPDADAGATARSPEAVRDAARRFRLARPDDLEQLEAAATAALRRKAGRRTAVRYVTYVQMPAPPAGCDRVPVLFIAEADDRAYVLSSLPLPWLCSAEL